MIRAIGVECDGMTSLCRGSRPRCWRTATTGEIASLSGAGDDPRYFQISVPVQPGNSGGALVDERGNFGRAGSPLPAVRPNAKTGAHGVTRPTGCVGGAGGERGVAGVLADGHQVNYAVKSSLLLSFLESVPAVSAKLKAPVAADRKFEEVAKSAQDAAVLVLVY
jgi:hypothetical protein